MSHIASRLSAVKPSASMAVSQAAKDLAATGIDMIDLGLGEPDFPAPAHITEAAFEAARRERMLYTASLGTPDLRKAIVAKFKRENGLDYAIDEIAVASGAKQSCTSVSAPAQIAAKVALDGPQDCVSEFRTAFERRRDLVVEGIAKINALSLDPPEGAFYANIGCAALIGAKTPSGQTLEDDVAVAKYLLDEGHVAAVPGTAYGLSPFFRISTATSEEVLAEAVRRISAAVAKLEF